MKKTTLHYSLKFHQLSVLCFLAYLLIGFGLVLMVITTSTPRVTALPYGEGLYGTCQYDTCAISLSSSGSVDLSLILSPSLPTTCSVNNDTVAVTTRSSTGYTLAISSSTNDTALNGTEYNEVVDAVSHTSGSPGALAANTWGYRVDGGAFGAGPTSELSSTGIPSVSFAGLPDSSSPSTITTSNTPADAAQTNVWFGVCANISLAADMYTNGVVYSALVN